MPTDEERFKETEKLMMDAFKKAELARQPEIKYLREQKRLVDQRIHTITMEVMGEVLEVLKSRARRQD